MDNRRLPDMTSNASDTLKEAHEAMKMLEGVEASLRYSAQVSNTIHRLGTWLLGKGRMSGKGGR